VSTERLLAILAAVLLAVCIHSRAARSAEAHTHEGAAGRFYQTWMMPDAPRVSCCHNEDCAPAASRFVDGHWEARWKDEDEWVAIPAGKVEKERDTPDGRSHMCGRRGFGGFNVFCFVPGGGS
jgi:hypothetical protein